MVIKAADFTIPAVQRTPNVVVVDPRFEAYGGLVASSREGRIGLHLRSGGVAALRLAKRLDVDVWIVASDLDDMSGGDFVRLLAAENSTAAVAMVGPTATAADRPEVDLELREPITCLDLERLLALPVAARGRGALGRGSWAALPVGLGAAVVAIAALMIG